MNIDLSRNEIDVKEYQRIHGCLSKATMKSAQECVDKLRRMTSSRSYSSSFSSAPRAPTSAIPSTSFFSSTPAVKPKVDINTTNQLIASILGTNDFYLTEMIDYFI